MNPIVRWFHQLGSPPYFFRFAGTWIPWLWALAALGLIWGLWLALYQAPADYQQGDSARILYLHVPSAWMSLFVYALMAFYAAIALIWRIKLCEALAMACAPIGAAFTVITLATGSIWGRPMWGTWWEWDPRLTSELILLFLYLGVIGLNAAIEERRTAARAAGFLAIVGVAILPIIRYSVEWWNSLHQGATVKVFGESSLDPSMVLPLVVMVIATKFWFLASLLQRARLDMLAREAGKEWARALAIPREPA
ncbi:MAG TPA: heme ABC transporter permease [Xanthomonadales bacterium]|nr:heme ABC transporter permease [Xanthomonadales bacterium]